MIKSLKSPAAREVFEGRVPKGFPADLAKATRRRLGYLHAAVRFEDLRSPPGNRLHALTGDREGKHSISVNDPFRICSVWTGEGPAEVEFVDCH